MRAQISDGDWQQLRVAFFGGAGLRQLARNAGISEFTLLSRARREKWTEQRDAAKALGAQARELDTRDLPAIVQPAQAAAMVLAEGNPGLTLKEKRSFLRSVVTTPIGQVDESSPLAQSVKRRATTNRAGDTCLEAEIKLPDKLKAIELDAKLSGELSDRPPTGRLARMSRLDWICSKEAQDEIEALNPPGRDLSLPWPHGLSPEVARAQDERRAAMERKWADEEAEEAS